MGFVSTSPQYEIGNMQLALHPGEDNTEKIEQFITRINNEFLDYNQYRILIAKQRSGNESKRILVLSPGFEEFKESGAAKKFEDYINASMEYCTTASVFEIRLFISYDEPKL